MHPLSPRVAKAWKENAPDAKFAGMTLDEFVAASKAASDRREELLALATQRRSIQDLRDEADTTIRDNVQRSVAAVRSDPAFGLDAPLLTAMCYVPRKSRKSGLTRRNPAQPEAVTPAKATA